MFSKLLPPRQKHQTLYLESAGTTLWTFYSTSDTLFPLDLDLLLYIQHRCCVPVHYYRHFVMLRVAACYYLLDWLKCILTPPAFWALSAVVYPPLRVAWDQPVHQKKMSSYISIKSKSHVICRFKTNPDVGIAFFPTREHNVYMSYISFRKHAQRLWARVLNEQVLGGIGK